MKNSSNHSLPEPTLKLILPARAAHMREIQQLNSISNLTCDFTVGFDNSVMFHGVIEWSLYGFVKGFVDGGSDDWYDISKEELEKLETESLLERKI